MMVSHDQAVRGDKRPGAAGIKPDGRLLQVLQPLGCGPEIIALLQDFRRRVVKKPHTFVSLRANRWNGGQSHGKRHRAPARQTSSHTALLFYCNLRELPRCQSHTAPFYRKTALASERLSAVYVIPKLVIERHFVGAGQSTGKLLHLPGGHRLKR